MGRIFTAYEITRATPHAQATSTGTGDIQTLTRPNGATACFLNVATTAARITFDGTNPSSSNGVLIQAAAQPIFFPIGRTLKVASSAAAASIVDVLWLE